MKVLVAGAAGYIGAHVARALEESAEEVVRLDDLSTGHESLLAGGLCLVEEMLARGVTRLVFSSTCAVYGAPRQVPIPEDHPHAPISPHGASNAAGAHESGDIGELHSPETHLAPIVVDGSRPADGAPACRLLVPLHETGHEARQSPPQRVHAPRRVRSAPRLSLPSGPSPQVFDALTSIHEPSGAENRSVVVPSPLFTPVRT